ncbi:MAG: glycosyltransferase family 1 protein [Methylococcaceae bacterium]
MKILLVGNYLPDNQQSMGRYAELLRDKLLEKDIKVTLITPCNVLLRLSFFTGSLKKWLAYIDKYILFPVLLRWKAKSYDVVHICDHSNSPYARFTGKKPTLITCHDMLAIRGAMNDFDSCPATTTGRLLQKWILSSFAYADLLVCVSQFTMDDVLKLTDRDKSAVTVNHLGLNFNYRIISTEAATEILASIPEFRQDIPYLLNVGSSIARKNREAVIRIFAGYQQRIDAVLIFAGAPLTTEQKKLVEQLGIKDKVIEVLGPSNDQLMALYNKAQALLFPSIGEGFGWPAIEAQACGCPVVSSSSGSLAEVTGEGGVVLEHTDEQGMLDALIKISTHDHFRNKLIHRGLENMSRFNIDRMINRYISLYQQLATTL